MDTEWEHPSTKEYLLDYLQPKIGRVEVLRNEKGGMRDIIFHNNRFPSRLARFCTGELKLRPIKKYLRALDEEVVNAVGIRAQESLRRSKYPEWEYSKEFQVDVWRPLIRWTEEDVIAMHHRHNIRPNPLYLLGSDRVGCWPCIFSNKKSLRILAKENPERISDIRQLEKDLDIQRKERDPKAPFVSWFSLEGKSIPIDKVIDWAHKDRSGRELFASGDRETGCMRWGLCEIQHPMSAQTQIIKEEKNEAVDPD
jgi:3'-phosphoadenosine 5'-phosphosulfate sulfotransferase (PAPS reductase)/FAD synthetase